MARYLQRLVARAGIVNEPAPAMPASVAPAFRAQQEFEPGDPFEIVESRGALRPPAPSPFVDAPALHTAQALPSPDKPRHPEGPPERSEILRPHITPAAQDRVLTEPTRVFHETVHEIELRPPARIVEPERAPESVRGEHVAVPELLPATRLVPASGPPAVGPEEIERNVLQKVMPALDAWFNAAAHQSPAPDQPSPGETSARLNLAPAQRSDSDFVTAAAESGPEIVIGSIRVDITPAAAAAPMPASRARAAMTPRPNVRRSPARLGFGLGQM